MAFRASTLAHPSFKSALGVVVGYGVILLVLVSTLYLVPYLVFRLL